MAINDVKADYTPKNLNIPPVGPSVSQFRAALTAYSSTTYTSAVLNTMTERDMIYACKALSLSVTGL